MRSIVLAAAFFAVSCGLPPENELNEAMESSPVAAKSEALCSCGYPTAPPIPATPVEFSQRYPAGTPLYSGRIGSAYTVIFKNPNRPYDFKAYGFDIANNTNVFFVHGTSADLVTLRNQHTLDVDSINIILKRFGDTSITDGIQGQVGGRGPGTPPIGYEATIAHQIAYMSFQANQQNAQAY